MSVIDTCGAGDAFIAGFLYGIRKGWEIVREHHLEKEFCFKDFKKALVFANVIGHIAEEEGHHPDLYISWGKLKIQIWTHKIDGLTESDFILAAKIDELPRAQH